MSSVYVITNLDGYVSQMRQAVADSIVENNQENLDDYITLSQVVSLVKENSVGFDIEDRPMLNEDTNEKLFEDISIWIHNAVLAKLAAQNLIECAWDDNINEMVFWQAEKSDVQSNNTNRKNKTTKRPDSGL